MAAGAYIFAPAGLTLDAQEQAFFREADPFGFILFARNVETPAQLRQLTAALRETVGREAPIFIDQEGGRVQRMRAPHWREWLPPLDQAARGGAAAMALRYRIIAEELRAVGIDGNCAPQLDLARSDTHPFLRNRCYGDDPVRVADLGRAVADALLAGGVFPVLKHMPGHGRAQVDSHVDLPRTDAALGTLVQTDFSPFRALSDLPFAMTAHVVFEALDPDRPATTSPVVLSYIRQELGFNGALMTDDLSMEALPGSVSERAAAAQRAGCDLILHCNGKRDEMAQIRESAGRLNGVALARCEAALAARRSVDPVDIPVLEAELERLMGEPSNA